MDESDDNNLLLGAFLFVVKFVEFTVEDLEVITRLLVRASDPLRLDLQFSDCFTQIPENFQKNINKSLQFNERQTSLSP
jgi:hypothetical protein